MVVDNETINVVNDFIQEHKNLLIDNEIDKLFKEAYNLDDTEFATFTVVMLKAGIVYTKSNNEAITEITSNVDDVTIKVKINELDSIYNSYKDEIYNSKPRDMIDIETCIRLVEDPYDVIKDWNYDSQDYDYVLDEIQNGGIKIDEANKFKLQQLDESDRTSALLQAALQATESAVANDASKSAIDAIIESFEKDNWSKKTEVKDYDIVEVTVSIKQLIKDISDIDEWSTIYYRATNLIIEDLCRTFVDGYIFEEPSYGFDSSFTDAEYNTALSDVLLDF